MALQLRTLYRLDADGRMLAVNEFDGPAAPRLAIGRTLAGTVWRFRHDVPPELAVAIDDLLAAEPPPRDLREPPRSLARVRAILAAQAPVASEYFGPAWYCPAHLAPVGAVAAHLVTDAAE